MRRAATRERTDPAGSGTPLEFGRILADGITHVVWSGNVGGTGLSVAGNVARVCGCREEQLLAAPSSIWVDRAHAADRGRVEDAYNRLIVTGEPFDEEYRWVRWDGATVWLHSRAALRSGAAAPTIDALIVDVSERRRLLDEIQHSQKLEAVGEFTGGIAHDFNNLLAVILANLTLLLDAIEPADPRRTDAAAALEAAERAAALTRQLLPFTRKHTFQPAVIDLNGVVGAAEPLLRRVLGSDIDFVVRLFQPLPQVRADAHLLEQVLMNLAVNARDAMPGGGTLTIESAAVRDGTVRLTVGDTGCGIDSATRPRIFEPFFTTKAHGRGTGLGLAVSRRIIEQCGGTLEVESRPACGSVFEIVLPAIDAAPAADAVAAPGTWRAFSGDERILLVEDDDGVRGLARRMLTSLGYDVVCARGAEEALAAVQAQRPAFDLLLSDVIMPRVNGAQVAQLVRQHSPSTRVLLTSGHSEETLVARGILDGQLFIHKPFTPATLARRVREVLDV